MNAITCDRCEKPKSFKTIRGYNTHMTRTHGLTANLRNGNVSAQSRKQEIFQAKIDLLQQAALDNPIVPQSYPCNYQQNGCGFIHNNIGILLAHQQQCKHKEVVLELPKIQAHVEYDNTTKEATLEEEYVVDRPVWYDMLNVKWHSLADDLWRQYNCQNCVDLYDAFAIYVSEMTKQKKTNQLIPFSYSYETVKQSLTLIEQNKYKYNDRFMPTLYGFCEINQLRGRRVQVMKILQDNGFQNLCSLQNQKQKKGQIKQDLDICLRAQRLNDDDSIIFAVDRPSYDNTTISRSAELWKIEDVLKEIAVNKKIQFNQIISSKISQNIKFFMDIDIKDKMESIKSQKQREQLVDDIEKATKQALKMYGIKSADMKFEIVGIDITWSFHLYTGAIVRLDDCKQIITVIIEQLVTLRYNRKELEKVLDIAPYPAPGKKSQLRFPSSDKMEVTTLESNNTKYVKMLNKQVANITGDFSRFVFQPRQLKNQEITPHFYFMKATPWQNEYQEEQEEQKNEEQEERERQHRQEYMQLSHELNQQLRRIEADNPVITQRRIAVAEFKEEMFKQLNDLKKRYLNRDRQSTNTVNRSFIQWLQTIPGQQMNNKKTKITYDGDCPICQRYHKSAGNRTLFISGTKDETIKVKCVRDLQREPLIFRSEQQANRVIRNGLHRWCIADEFQGSAVMNKQYVHFDALPYHFTFVQSPVGSGKTTQVIQNIQEFERINNRSARVMFISVRVSFSHSTVSDIYKKYGMKFDLYDDKEIVDISKCDKIMIQVESTPRITKKYMELDANLKYDFIIMDEAISLVKQTNSRITNPIGVIYGLRQLMVQAQHVIVLDAFLNRLTKQFIQSLGEARSHQLIINTFKPYEQMPCEFIQQSNSKQAQNQYIKQTIDALNNGNCVFSFFDQREEMLNIKDKLLQAIEQGKLNVTKEQILDLHGLNLKKVIDNDGEEKTHIKQKKKIYKEGSDRLDQYRLIMFTRTLTVGIDCQLEKFTHGIHLLDHLRFSQSFEVVQAIHRFRKVKTQTLIHCGQRQGQNSIEKNAITPFGQMLKYCSRSNGISQEFRMLEHDDICLKFQILCDITDQYMNKNGIQLIAGFMAYLGYSMKHTESDQLIDNSFVHSRLAKPLEYEELSHETIKLCDFIRQNGTNNLPEECEKIKIQELYNVYCRTRYYLSNFVKPDDITSMMIINNQEQAFKICRIKSQLMLADQCTSRMFFADNLWKTDEITNKRVRRNEPVKSQIVNDELQGNVRMVLSGYKHRTVFEHSIEDAKLQAKLLFLGLVRINGESFQDHVACDETLEHLLQYQDNHKELMKQCINHALPKGFNNEFINGKLLAEMIKSCGFEVKTKQKKRPDGQRIRKTQAVIVVLPQPIL